jgi:hypothetical protein
MTAGRRRALAGFLACLAVFWIAASPLRAADEDRPLELWLDRPLPQDVPAGTEIPIGLMVWDTQAQAFVTDNPPFVRLHPAAGDAEPSQVTLVEDWRGHYAETIQVPQAGMGTFEAGFGGTACDETSCRRAETIFPIGGVGPPPGAALPTIATAEILIDGAAVAGQPADVSIHLQPNVAWSGETFATPDQLILQVREPRAEVIDQVPAMPGTTALRYDATILLPEAADYVLQVAADEGGDAPEVFGASLIPITATVAPSSEPASTGGGPSLELLVVLALAGVVLLAGGALVFAMRRA